MLILEKTEAGRLALAANARQLTPRERTLVLLADGRRTLQELCDLVIGAHPETLHSLHERGYLLIRQSAGASTAGTASRGRRRTGPLPSEDDDDPVSDVPQDWPATVARHPGDTLTRIRWARTPAATKLYLLDVVERTFAGSDRPQWERLRDLLREVRDEDSLSLAMDSVTEALAAAAGEERAQSLRHQLTL